jgi:alpha-tubulin suppressor-like RCC1 family protein
MSGNSVTICFLDDDGPSCSSNTEFVTPRLPHATQVAAGAGHACAIDDERVKCWADGSYDQDAAQATVVPPGIALIGRHACVALPDGGVRCVGFSDRGQLGTGDDAPRPTPLAQATPIDLGGSFGPVATVAMGFRFTCALSTSGAIKCWGDNGYGQLGLGDEIVRGAAKGDMGDALPALTFGGGPMAKLALGEDHACALGRQNELFCWGRGASGQLGTEATADVGTTGGPVRPRLKAGLAIGDLALGASHTCVLTLDHAVYCFGKNDAGQLGLGHAKSVGDRPGTMGESMLPVKLGDDFVATSIASGGSHVCALSDQGTVKCWGANDAGQLGLGDTANRGASPNDLGAALPTVDLGHGQIAVDLACGLRHCCVRTIENTMKCWGDNSGGQLGLGDLTARGTTPESTGDNLPFVMTPPGERVLSISLGAKRTCARTDGGLRCWGKNEGGELGYGDQQGRGGTPETIPRLLPPLGI